MINKVKRIIALLMITVMMVTSFSACGNDAKETTAPTNDTLTRGQWVTMLGESFGMDSYKNEEPYYKDVESDNAIFPYVQSCYEWKVLSTGTDEFKPDDIATVGFVVSTASLAAELDYSGYMTGDNLNDALIQCAYEKGLYDVKPGDKSLSEAMTVGNAILVVNAAVNAYMNATEEEHIDVEYMENVVNYTDVKDSMTVADNGNVTMPQANAEGLSEGDIFYIEATIENPDGAAYKVVSKTQNADGTYTLVTEAPTFEEIFKEIDLYVEPEIKAENVFPVEGVTMTVVTDNDESASSTKYITNAGIDDLSSTDNRVDETATVSAGKTITLSFEFDFKDKKSSIKANEKYEAGLEEIEKLLNNSESATTEENTDTDAVKVEVNRESKLKELAEKTGAQLDTNTAKTTAQKMEEYIRQYNTGLLNKEGIKKKVEELKKEANAQAKKSASLCFEPAFKAGYELTGKVEVSLGVKAEAEFGLFSGFDSFMAKGTLDILGEIEFEGKIESDVTIAKVVIPVGGVFSIEGALKLYCDINGKLSIKMELDNEAKISFNDDSDDVKTTANSKGSVDFEAGVSIEVGPKIDLAICALGYDIADVELSAGVLAKAEASGGISAETVLLEDDFGVGIAIWASLGADVGIYAPIVKIEVGGKDTLLEELGISAKVTIIDEDSAPFKLELPIDDVKEPLYYKEIIFYEEETTQEETSEEESTTLADTDVNYNNGITVSEQVVLMEDGDKKTLDIVLPTGYDIADVQWDSSDDLVATVSNGEVTAKHEGYAYITVKTKDGKYSGKCLIIVEE